MSSPLADFVAFVGAACLDIVLCVPSYPCEDGEVRVSSVSRSAGGNATNSALVCAQLLCAVGGVAEPRVHLVAPASDPASDGDAAALHAALRAGGVCVNGLVAVAATGLPTSYIALAPGSRTILHARSIRELAGGEAAAALRCSACGTRPAWVHAEGRALEATAAAFCAARAAGGARPVLSLELEKARDDGDVEAALLPLADVVVIGAEYARGVRGLGDATAAIAHVLGAAAITGRTPALVIAPWGAAGAWASAAPAAPGGARVEAHAPARAPAGGVVDTLGAGDVFVAALVAYALCAPAPRAFVAGVRAGAPAALTAPQLAAWLDFACAVAGEKVGVRGLTLPPAALAAARAVVAGREAGSR
jgi:sugar/nucleoside kinase (ribokinase family)